MATMDREELLDVLWDNAEHLNDKELEEAASFLEGLAYPERASHRPLADAETKNTMSYDQFIAELSTKIRTADEAV